MWVAWKTVFRLTHLKRQYQILGSGGGSLLVGFKVSFLWRRQRLSDLKQNNLTLVATNNTAVLQQLMAANLAFTATAGTLTVTNKN